MRILDLFCGNGLASIGYKMAFPDAEVTGVDVVDMSSCYPFNFVQRDALSLTYDDLAQYDLIHASPPCQPYSKVTPRKNRGDTPRLIPQTKLMLHAANKPYVIENVEGSGQDLQPDICIWLNEKRRYFACSFRVPAAHKMSSSYSSHLFGEKYVPTHEIARAWGVPDEYQVLIRRKGLRQGVPPVMIEWLMRSAYER